MNSLPVRMMLKLISTRMMENKNIFRISVKQILTILIVMLHGSVLLYSQNLKKEVYVESNYRPEIADAEKYGMMPTIQDTLAFNTKIDYNVLPGRLKSDYSARPIKPAKMVGSSLDKLYNSYLKAGLGNYTTPLVEYSIQNLRSKEYAVGAYVFHKSSHYNQELVEEMEKIPAGVARTELSAFGKRFFNNVNVMGEVGANRHNIRHYGLRADLITDTTSMDKWKQTYNDVYFKTGVYSTNPDSSAFDYSLFLNGNYFWDHYKNKEPHFNLNATLGHPVGTFRLAADLSYDHYKLSNSTDTASENIFTIHPFLSKRKEEWQLTLGARLSYSNFNDSGKVYLYPEALFKFRVIEKAITAYLGVSGYLENNSYAGISETNPYIIPGLRVANTNHPYIIYGGLEGYLSSKAGYRFEVSMDARDSVPFFANDTINYYQNMLMVIYDDADVIKYHAELNWTPLSYLGFYLRSNFHSYKMINQAKAWHKPSFDLAFTVSYNFKEKIYADLDFFLYGKRYAPDYTTATTVPGIITLDPVYDLNLKLEYKYSDVLGFFLHFYNITNSRYYLWNQYPSQRLMVLGGINYKF
jgi:hypothetical protein